MPDDETETEVETDTVVVGDVDNAPDEVTNEGDTTVVVEVPDNAGNDDAVDAVVIAKEIDLSERVAILERELAEVRATASTAEVVAEIALDATEDLAEADAEIVAATDEAIVETLEDAEIEDTDNDGDDEIVIDEIAPVSTRVHPWFRSMDDWRGKSK